VITTEVVITGCRRRCIDSFSSGLFRPKGTIESAQDQAIRTQSSGVAGTQFRFALRAVWHLDQDRSSNFMPLAPRSCNLPFRDSLFEAAGQEADNEIHSIRTEVVAHRAAQFGPGGGCRADLHTRTIH
jgi:hypothetical protein